MTLWLHSIENFINQKQKMHKQKINKFDHLKKKLISKKDIIKWKDKR